MACSQTCISTGRKKFLQFCTGSQLVPPIGFETSKISLSVNRHAEGVTTSTCFHTVTLPEVVRYADLKSIMDTVVTPAPLADDFNTQ